MKDRSEGNLTFTVSIAPSYRIRGCLSHHLVLRFDDDNHITETWIWCEEGKDRLTVFHLTRKTK